MKRKSIYITSIVCLTILILTSITLILVFTTNRPKSINTQQEISVVETDITKANNMNEALEEYSQIKTVETVSDVVMAVYKKNINFVSIDENNRYYWDSVNNKILCVNSENEVLNIENYDTTNIADWFLLNFEEGNLSGNISSYEDIFND
ncbi:MAG: hypothetical protein IJT25_00060 [Clostridia bacterium]|nr:hypothetical protein [Clostridia bacterium]